MMKLLFEWGIDLLEIGILLDFMNRYFGFKHTAPKRYAYCAIAFVLQFIQIAVSDYFLPLGGVDGYLEVGILFAYAYFCLLGEPIIQFFISAFITTAIMLIANGCILLFNQLIGYDPTAMIMVFGPIRVIAVLLTKLILFYLTRILIRVKEQARLEKGDILPVIVIPLISLVGISLMMKSAFQRPEVRDVVLYAVLVIWTVNLITYYLFVRLSKESRAKMEHALLRQQYEFMRHNMQEIGVLHQEFRSARHDIKNHLLSLSILLQQTKLKNAREYLSQLLKQQDVVEYQLPQTGNEVLDVVLGIKLAVCRKERIHVTLNIQHPLLFMQTLDVNALFANLLDNAIEACRQSEESKIELAIVPQEPYVAITLCNSVRHSILTTNPHLRTTKSTKDEHGFGVRNIRKITERYSGIVEYFEDQNRFCCDILLEDSAKQERFPTK